MERDEQKPLMSHLEELRKRLIACALAIGLCFALTYAFSEKLFAILAYPLKSYLPEGDRLIFTNLPEMFFVYIKTALVSGLLLAAPFIFFQIWMFVAPGLFRNEKKYVFPFVFCSTFLFIGGALFGYFVVFPFGFRFFLGFANEYIQALPSVKQYFSLSIKLLLGFGLIFELPVLAFFLGRMGVISVNHLRKQRRYAILLIFVVSAILTPPDVITQIMMAGPLLILFELSVIIVKLAEKKKTTGEEEGTKG
ncbi:MAG: twin-arginine translocase subunit TatC [Deltaproteobacteria bacterium]|nr:twin-arginine translocase subunit TatC [Deltaproteobacteria bacterium]